MIILCIITHGPLPCAADTRALVAQKNVRSQDYCKDTLREYIKCGCNCNDSKKIEKILWDGPQCLWHRLMLTWEARAAAAGCCNYLRPHRLLRVHQNHISRTALWLRRQMRYSKSRIWKKKMSRHLKRSTSVNKKGKNILIQKKLKEDKVGTIKRGISIAELFYKRHS